MHEVGVAKEVLNLALEKSKGKKVKKIKVELAEDGHTTPESLQYAFSMVAKGSLAEGAHLDIMRTDELESRVVELEVEK